MKPAFPTGACANKRSVTTSGSPTAAQGNLRALATGNLHVIRGAAAELPRIGVAEAAAILLVIARSAPVPARRGRWLGRLCLERERLALEDLGRGGGGALPERPEAARPLLAHVCSRARHDQAATVFRAARPP